MKNTHAINPLKLTLITLIMLCYITTAAVIEDQTFKEAGYKDTYITGAAVKECKEIKINQSDINGEFFEILSLKADFLPTKNDSAKISVSVNDYNTIADLRPSDFETGFARIQMPKEKIAKSNTIHICGTTSEDVNSIIISQDSVYGVYSGAYFPEGKGVKLELETYEPFAGVPFTVRAVARNYGTEDAEILLTYRKQELEEKTPEVSVLKGETTSTGTVPKCRERDPRGNCITPGEYSISYSIVANKAIPFTLLPAVMKYTNVFGEEEIMLSNRPNMGAKEPPHKIAVKLASEKDAVYGSRPELVFIVKNISNTEVKNIVVYPDSGFEIEGEQSKTIAALAEQSETMVSFQTKPAPKGIYRVGCIVEYENRSRDCEFTNLKVEESLGGEEIASVFLTFIAIGVFAFLYFRK